MVKSLSKTQGEKWTPSARTQSLKKAEDASKK
jgi:hypothetical protein